MRMMLTILVVLCSMAALAVAGPNAGGTVTLHWSSAIPYTGDAAYGIGGLLDCQSSVVQAPPAPSFPPPWAERRMWFAYAAFPAGSSPRMKAVAIGVTYPAFAGMTGVKIDWVGTPPGTTEAQTSDPAWPLPNSGNALVFGTTMTALVDEIFTFAGYGSQGQIFALRPHPSTPSNFADDAVPANQDPIEDFGTLGFGIDGVRACPTGRSGACCYPNGSCRFLVQELCSTGDWRSGVLCTPNPCSSSPGACCFGNGSCQLLDAVQCSNLGGIWSGSETTCDPNLCPQPGACCYPDGACEFVAPNYCETGDFRPGVSCDPNPCPPAGACCHTDGSCTIRTESRCGSPDTWLGAGTTCTPNPCPQPSGACCYADGHCEFLIHLACPTGDWRFGVACTPNPCPPPQDPCAQTPRRQGGPKLRPGVVVNWDLANHAQPIDKNTYVGDGLGDGREGGEDFGSAMVIGSLPFTDTGATCDNADNITLPCASSAAPDVVYSYTPFTDGQINVSLCGSGYDCALGIYNSGQICLCCNDDFCGLQSEIDNIRVIGGQTYYLVVDGFSTNCGSYLISLLEFAPPPPLECPAGAQLEGEPDCYDGYVDTYNGGCNSAGYPFSEASAVLCGKSGTYLYQGLSYRDTDWFVCTAIGGEACATWTGTFPILGFMMYNTPSCPVESADSITGNPLQPVTLCRNFAANEEFWLWAGPSVFTGVPCGSDYILEVTGIACCPPPTPGACCIGDVCHLLTAADCLAQGGHFVGGACESAVCVVPTETQSWGRIKYLFK